MSDPNDSATGGILATDPAFGLDEEDADIEGLDEGLLDGTIAVTDLNLDDFLQAWLSEMSGIPGDRFRPRWQPEPPNLPEFGSEWVAFGVTRVVADTFAATLHNPAEDGFDEMRRHEVMDIIVSVFGVNARGRATLLRDNLLVPQNNEILQKNSMGFVEASDLLIRPALIKNRWTRCADLTIRIKRQVVREYPIYSLEGMGPVGLYNEHYVTNINLPPAP